MPTLTVFGDTADQRVGSVDASTYSAARSGFNLTVANAGQTLWGLVLGGYYIYESFEKFDTSSLGGGAEVTDVVLSLFGNSIIDTDGWNNVHIRVFDWGASVTTADWRATDGTSVTDTLVASRVRTGLSASSYNDFESAAGSDADFIAAVNKTGTTFLYALISDAESATAPTGTNRFYFDNADTSGTSQDPKLVVTFTSIEISSVTPSTFADGDTGVTIAGSGFGATQGTGKVELGDSSDYATATLVAQTVTAWADTSIDFTVVQGALPDGQVYVFVTSDAGDTTAGFAAAIPHEMSAIVAGVSSASASLTPTRNLSAAPAGTSAVSAALTVERPFIEFVATVAGTSTVSADMVLAASLAATSAGVSSASASLDVVLQMAAAVSAESTVSADLAAILGLAAVITAQSEVTATFAGGRLTTYVPPGVARDKV